MQNLIPDRNRPFGPLEITNLYGPPPQLPSHSHRQLPPAKRKSAASYIPPSLSFEKPSELDMRSANVGQFPVYTDFSKIPFSDKVSLSDKDKQKIFKNMRLVSIQRKPNKTKKWYDSLGRFFRKSFSKSAQISPCRRRPSQKRSLRKPRRSTRLLEKSARFRRRHHLN